MSNNFFYKSLTSACALCVLLIAGCQSIPDVTPPQGDDHSPEAYEYIIGPGDDLSIFVWGYEDLSITLPVRPDGRITTRLVEDMPASGKTPTQLARDIEQVYEQFVKNPTVSITVSEFVGSPKQQVRVIGGGSAPRTVPFVAGMSLLDLMIDVGGLREFSKGNKAVLVRTTEEGRQSYRVKLDDLLRKGDMSADVPISPGDIVIIPEAWF